MSRRFARISMVMLFAATCAWTAGAARPEEATGRFERTLKVNGTVDLDVETGAGKITVRTGESSTVRVIGSIKAVKIWILGSGEEMVRKVEKDPPIEQNGNFIRVGRFKDGELSKGVSISYEFIVPADTRVRAKSGVGDISVDGIRGNVHANTGAGSLWVLRTGGEVWADTGVGDVEIRGAKGIVRAKSGAGSIKVEGTPKGTWELDTGIGNVSVQLPANAAFDLRASTGVGSIHTKHPIEVTGDIASSSARGKVRGGGPLLDIKSGAGSIYID